MNKYDALLAKIKRQRCRITNCSFDDFYDEDLDLIVSCIERAKAADAALGFINGVVNAIRGGITNEMVSGHERLRTRETETGVQGLPEGEG